MTVTAACTDAMGAGASHAAKQDRKENEMIAQKTGYTVEQVEGWRDMFMEECPSGKLSKSKFTDIYKKMFPRGKSAAFYEHMFRVYDLDHSGTLEFSEFMEAVSVTEHGRPEDVLDLAFRLYDVDGNGTIEMRELSEILRALYAFRRDSDTEVYLSQVLEIMRRLDKNRDGVLSKQEFIQGCLRDKEMNKLLLGGITPQRSNSSA